jgi:ABC-type sulfate transport system permease subunit
MTVFKLALLILIPSIMIHWWAFREVRYHEEQHHLKVQLSRMGLGLLTFLIAMPVGVILFKL